MAEEICKMQIKETSKGGLLLSFIIKTARYLDDCMQNLFLGEHQRKQLNSTWICFMQLVANESRAEMFGLSKALRP